MAKKRAKREVSDANMGLTTTGAQAASPVGAAAARRGVVDPALKKRFKREVQVINYTTIFLTVLFAIVGFAKLSAVLTADLHRMYVRDCERYINILNLGRLGMDAVALRVLIGISEIFLAVGLLTTRALTAGLLLTGIMIGTIFVQILLKDQVYFPALVLLILLIMISVRLRVRRLIAKDSEDALKDK